MIGHTGLSLLLPATILTSVRSKASFSPYKGKGMGTWRAQRISTCPFWTDTKKRASIQVLVDRGAFWG